MSSARPAEDLVVDHDKESDAEHSSFASVPQDVLAGLFDQAKAGGDPALRDYGERYQYIDILGEGGQGVVIDARDTLLDRDVAIKALKAPLESAREEYLRREARVCGMLEHPNILPTYDLCSDETGSPFFVMKKIEGVSLEDMLRTWHEQRTAPRRVAESDGVSRFQLLQLFLQVCHAIEFAHSRGVLHLDLKPANVKLGAFGEVYVLDWGFAAKMDEQQRLLGGTPIYIAPERMRGLPPDPRSDVYSLGVMLYRILVNRLPRNVGKMSFKDYRERFLELPVIPPRSQDRTIPRALEAIVLKAMENDPNDRYQSVRAMAEDITRFMDLLPVKAYREGPLARSWRFLRRHRRLAAVATLILVAAVVSGVLVWRDHRLQTSIRLRAQARIPLEKASTLVEQHRQGVENITRTEERLRVLKPAFVLFDEAVRKTPEWAAPYYQRGRTYQLALAMQEALADYKKAYTLDSSFVMAHYYAGMIYADVFRDYAAARREFNAMKAVERENEYSELGQARIELVERHFARALERCERIERKNPALPDVWYIRGMVYGSKKDDPHYCPQKALDAYNRFLSSSARDNPSAYANRGDIRRVMGDYDGAIADYGAALAVNPRYVWALLNRGYLLYKEKDAPLKGLADIEAALRVDPQNFWGYMNRGAIYESLKRFSEAEEDYNWARDLDRTNPIVWYRLGVYYLRVGRLREADAALSHSLELSRGADRAVWVHRRGAVRLVMGRYADAVRDFEESLRLRTSGKIYPALMRWIALQKMGTPLDQSDFERNLAVPPDKPWLAAVGALFLGDATEEEIHRLSSTPQAQCESEFYLGAFYWVRGENEKARMHFTRSVKTEFHLYVEHSLSGLLLRQLEKHPPAEVGG